MDVGVFGKLPSHGDFLRRRVPDAFVLAWDAWLQLSIAASRELLGEHWLDVFLTSPAWRFSFSAGICGPTPIAGLMVPSVDRVGRYFPITVAWQPPEDFGPLAVTSQCGAWFEAVERHIIETLGQQDVDFETFDTELLALNELLDEACTLPRVTLDPEDASALTVSASSQCHLPIGSVAELGNVFEQLLQHRLQAQFDPLALWWTEGSTRVVPSCLVISRLPAPQSFVAFLDGSWTESGWQSARAHVPAPETFVDTLVDEDRSFQLRSAACTDQGRVRPNNQDAFIERPEVGIWAVADGMGGHQDGDVASRMVCDAVAGLVPAETLETTVDALRKALDDVNAHLRRAAARPVGGVRSGSTVVAMLARRSRIAILWAGDSRAYRLRGGFLTRLTSDHSWSDPGGEPAVQSDSGSADGSFAITRAVGGADKLELDVHRDRIRKGDRILLCSDGLTREVDEAAIESLLRESDVSTCAHNLMQAALASGARDNVTVVVVEVF